MLSYNEIIELRLMCGSERNRCCGLILVIFILSFWFIGEPLSYPCIGDVLGSGRNLRRVLELEVETSIVFVLSVAFMNHVYRR